MKLSTAKYLRTVEIQGSWWNVLNQARRILSGKINDRLWAEASVHEISQSVFKRDITLQIAQLEWLNKNSSIEDRKNFSLNMRLILLKLQIFSILDKADAWKVWQAITQPEGLEKIVNDASFFYHVFYWPLLLLGELSEKWFLTKEIASVFPRDCIIQDYRNNVSPRSNKSSTQKCIDNLKAEIEKAEKQWNIEYLDTLRHQLQAIEDNIRRYF